MEAKQPSPKQGKPPLRPNVLIGLFVFGGIIAGYLYVASTGNATGEMTAVVSAALGILGSVFKDLLKTEETVHNGKEK